MKKIFALVLAVAMLSTTAFSAITSDGAAAVVGQSDNAIPGSKIYITPDNFTTTSGASVLSVPEFEFSNENFVIASAKYSTGGSLVKSTTIDNVTNQVVIELHENIGLEAPAANKKNNLVIEKISVKARKTLVMGTVPGVSAKSGTTYNYSMTLGAGSVKMLRVGYEIQPGNIDSPEYQNGKLVKFSNGKEAFGMASISDLGVTLEGRVYKDDKVYVKVDNAANTDVLKTAAYSEADLRFAKVTVANLSSNNTIKIDGEEGEFVYEIVEKVLVKSGLTWKAEDYAFVGKLNKTTAYVISDIELEVGKAPVAGDATTTNPETGANDVVGVAAALAVLSLVAAGAVSLKK